MKGDAEKLRWDLVPWSAAESMVDVLTFGARKYSPDNWRRVPDLVTRYRAAALRHIVAHAKGEKLDPESGKPHLAHALCCLAFMLEFELEGSNDDAT